MAHYPQLFTPTHIGKVSLKNRTSMAPMGPVGYADAFGGFHQRLQDYYVEQARHGVGLIITGICTVDTGIEGFPAVGLPCPTTMPLAFIHSCFQMNERIHAYGSKCFLQLTGGLGRSALPGFITKNIAPSEQGNRFDPQVIHREMTKEEILRLIQGFVTSAVVAKKAGFDGVEFHAVHEGYLLDQFAIQCFNRRADEFGGSLANRLRVSVMIVQGIKKACGPDFPVSLRYSLKSCMKALRQGGLPGEEYEEFGKDIPEGIEAAKLLVAAGYDALNLDAGTYDSWYWNHPPMYFEDGPYMEFGRILKREVDVPILLAGKLDNPELAVKALEDCCDIVSYGRALLTDPEYVEKVRSGRLDEIRPCLGCHEGCMGRIANAPVSCAVNPACGRERIYGIVPAARKKKVLVAGGGAAGLEAARTAALAGHSVTLCERSGALGGNLIPGGVPHFKRNDHKLISWYRRQLELLGVEVRLCTAVTPELVGDCAPDVVVTATGSTARKMTFPGDLPAVSAEDVLLGRADAGERVVLVGGGLVGCETALWLAQQGRQVNVVELLPALLGGHGALPHMNEFMLMDLLHFHRVGLHTGACVTDTRAGAVTVKKGVETLELPADTLITAVGYRSDDSLYAVLKDLDLPVYNIGDSREVHNIMYAVWNAYELARDL